MPRVTLKKAERTEVYEAAGGLCYVCGNHVPPFSSWGVAEGRLIDEGCNALRGSRALRTFRAYLAEKVVEGRRLVARFGKLVDEQGGMDFAGELLDGEVVEVPAEHPDADSSGNGVPEE